MNGYDYANNDPTTMADPAGTDPCSTGGDGCTTYVPGPTPGTGHNEPTASCTTDTTCSVDHPDCDLACQLNQPALPAAQIPWNYLKSNGYHGSDNFTYKDALEWGKTSKNAAMYVCEHVLMESSAACGDPTADPKNAAPAITMLILLILAPYLLAAVGRAKGGDDGLAGDNIFDDGTGDPSGTSAEKQLEDALGCASSFTPDTPVLMADGSTKPIKDIEVGDSIKATDPSDGVTTGEPVTQLHANLDADLTDITIAADGGGTATIHTTMNHPVWDLTHRQWTPAGRLVPGDLLSAADGSTVAVVAVRSWIGQREMRNLTVQAIHTYYVLAGSTPILVHNSSACLGRNLGTKPSADAQAHHIVPETDPLAAQARDILNKSGIGIDDAENGAWLGPRSHYSTYPKDYVRWVNDEIVSAYADGGAQGVRDALAYIKSELQGANQWALDQGY